MSHSAIHPTQPMHRSSVSTRPSNRYRTRPSINDHSATQQLGVQAELVAFTPPLMSIQCSNSEYPTYSSRNFYSPRLYMNTSLPTRNTQHSSLSLKHKSATTVPQPEYYVDNFDSNFSNKPTETNSTTKSKVKHVTFQTFDNKRSVHCLCLQLF
jgi:hypothetical protein